MFHLKAPNDQTFPQVLASPAGPIVDEKVFSATTLTPDADIVKANAFAGPYTITGYTDNTDPYKANTAYQGISARRRPRTST